jgi:hypothetical protein
MTLVFHSSPLTTSDIILEILFHYNFFGQEKVSVNKAIPLVDTKEQERESLPRL